MLDGNDYSQSKCNSVRQHFSVGQERHGINAVPYSPNRNSEQYILMTQNYLWIYHNAKEPGQNEPLKNISCSSPNSQEIHSSLGLNKINSVLKESNP